MEALLERLGQPPDALLTTAYVLLEGVFDALKARDLLHGPMALGTFGDNLLLDFLPLPVNSMVQQHEAIAEQVLQLALGAVENGNYQSGVQAVARTFRQRRRE